MNTLKDFWTEIDNRISSPLFASFIISWLVYNWRIPVALMFIKQDDLGPGYYSYFDLIEKQATLVSFTWPAIIAVIYTFGYPHLKEFIVLYLSQKDILVNEQLIAQTAETNIPFDKYFKSQQNLKELKIQYTTLIKDEDFTKEKYEALLQTEIELKSTIVSNTNKFNQDISVINKTQQLQISELNLSYDQNIKELNTAHDKRISTLNEESELRVNRISDDLNSKISELTIQLSQLKNDNNELHLEFTRIQSFSEIQQSQNIEYEKEINYLSNKEERLITGLYSLYSIQYDLLDMDLHNEEIGKLFFERASKIKEEFPSINLSGG